MSIITIVFGLIAAVSTPIDSIVLEEYIAQYQPRQSGSGIIVATLEIDIDADGDLDIVALYGYYPMHSSGCFCGCTWHSTFLVALLKSEGEYQPTERLAVSWGSGPFVKTLVAMNGYLELWGGFGSCYGKPGSLRVEYSEGKLWKRPILGRSGDWS